jgi:hypothetical protein
VACGQFRRWAELTSSRKGYHFRGKRIWPFDYWNEGVNGGGPQGLKPASLLALVGTAEAVPFPFVEQLEFFRSR